MTSTQDPSSVGRTAGARKPWRIERARLDHFTVIALGGEIDASSAGQARQELAAAIQDAEPAGAIIDLSGLEFGDSMAISVLVGVHKQARQRGLPLQWVSAPGRLTNALQTTGMYTALAVRADLAHAAIALHQATNPDPA